MRPGLFNDFHARFESSGLRGMFAPRKPRNVMLRVLLGLVGVALLAVLLVVGVFVGTAMLLFGLLRRLWRQPRVSRSGRDGDVLDVEYRVVPRTGRQALR